MIRVYTDVDSGCRYGGRWRRSEVGGQGVGPETAARLRVFHVVRTETGGLRPRKALDAKRICNCVLKVTLRLLCLARGFCFIRFGRRRSCRQILTPDHINSRGMILQHAAVVIGVRGTALFNSALYFIHTRSRSLSFDYFCCCVYKSFSLDL